MLSRIRSAKRRSSSRAIPGAPRQTWYCSVSLATNRIRGASSPRGPGRGGGGPAGGGRPAGRAGGGRGGARAPGGGGEREERVGVARPGRGDDDVRRHVARGVEALERG